MAYGSLLADVVQSSTSGPVTFQNTSGTEVGTLCRAWVSFTPSTGARLASFNVSSVTRGGAGNYTVNLTNAMTDANYVVSGSCGNNSNIYVALNSETSSSFNIYTRVGFTNAASDDSTIVGVAVFR